jgi:hypothetical protein
MFKTIKARIALLAALVVIAACAPLPTADPQAVRIEGTPGMSVIYLVRTNPDLSYVPAQIALDDRMLGVTYAGTYFRLEVPAGRHRISGFGVDGGTITIDTQADRIYFIRQTVAGSWRSPTSLSSFYSVIDEARARAAMAGASRAG